MTKKLPVKIFVKWDQPSSDELYLLASDEMYGLVGTDKTRIGTYQLIETTDAEMVVSTSKPIKTKR